MTAPQHDTKRLRRLRKALMRLVGAFSDRGFEPVWYERSDGTIHLRAYVDPQAKRH